MGALHPGRRLAAGAGGARRTKTPGAAPADPVKARSD